MLQIWISIFQGGGAKLDIILIILVNENYILYAESMQKIRFV